MKVEACLQTVHNTKLHIAINNTEHVRSLIGNYNTVYRRYLFFPLKWNENNEMPQSHSLHTEDILYTADEK